MIPKKYIIKTFADKDNFFTRIIEKIKGVNTRITFVCEVNIYPNNFSEKLSYILNGVSHRFFIYEGLDAKRSAQKKIYEKHGIMVRLQEIVFEVVYPDRPAKSAKYVIVKKVGITSVIPINKKYHLIQFYRRDKLNTFTEYVVNVDGSEKIFKVYEYGKSAEEHAVIYLYVKYNIRLKLEQIIWDI